jgi:hypothetical protein
MISGLDRKNCWAIVEHRGDTTPDGLQHLLARAKWDADAVRDDLRPVNRHAFMDHEYFPRSSGLCCRATTSAANQTRGAALSQCDVPRRRSLGLTGCSLAICVQPVTASDVGRCPPRTEHRRPFKTTDAGPDSRLMLITRAGYSLVMSSRVAASWLRRSIGFHWRVMASNMARTPMSWSRTSLIQSSSGSSCACGYAVPLMSRTNRVSPVWIWARS